MSCSTRPIKDTHSQSDLSLLMFTWIMCMEIPFFALRCKLSFSSLPFHTAVWRKVARHSSYLRNRDILLHLLKDRTSI